MGGRVRPAARQRAAPSVSGAMGEEQVHDVVIVGGGVAGINAALELVDVRLDVVVLEAGARLGGQLAEIPHSIRNVVPSVFPDGPALVSAMERTAGALLAGRVRFGHAVGSADVAAGWVEAAATRFRGRAILIATGSSPQVHPAAPDGAFGGDVTYHVETRPEPVRRASTWWWSEAATAPPSTPSSWPTRPRRSCWCTGRRP